ncbi:hypothetical protein AFLA_002093 [Aspergillus flavus NRRL3357]|nr:hypothetical protein AFLA_002093 [Aspergillus flavus NRRL3357]
MAVFPFNLKCSAVFLMISSFLAAVAFAIGYDMFYIRTRIDIIDNLLSVLKNGFTVANLRLWRHSPISVTLAGICWLLPVASIISPATSSVQLAPFNVYALKHIPRVDFTSANFASFISSLAINPRGPNFWSTLYNSHTAETQRVVNSVATQGTILPIDPPAVNSSWSVGFYRPAIVCDKVNQALATHITQNVAQAINRSKVLEADMLRFKRTWTKLYKIQRFFITVHVTDQTVLNPIVYTIGVINHDNEKPNTNIISTTLMETEEMRFIDSLTSPESDNPFPKYWREQSVSSSNHSSPPLSKALEDLFRNITLSLMSSNIFQPNYTVKAVPETNVTITSYHSIYIYNRPILWAAYGTARGATALSSIAGVLVYFSNGGSYGTKFSTVFRVTQGAKVSTNLSMKDYSGFDPLPDHIAKAKMTLGYNPDYPVRVSSTAPLDQPHQRPTDSSQLLDTTTGDSNKSSGP